MDEMCHLARAVPGTIQNRTPVAIELIDDLNALQWARFLLERNEFQKWLWIAGADVAIAGGGQPIPQGLKLKVLPPQFVLCLLKIGLVARELSFKACVFIEEFVEVAQPIGILLRGLVQRLT